MDLANTDKLAKDNKGVKHQTVRQYLFDRTADAKRMKTKNSKKTVRAVLTMITLKNHPKKIGSTGEPNLLRSLQNSAKLKEYKLILQ